MKAGHNRQDLPASVQTASEVYFFKSGDITWDVNSIWEQAQKPGGVYSEQTALVQTLLQKAKPDDQVVFMSNGGFGGIHAEFLNKI
jgi:UDP-N-acetylmuramate: L-alanyl-gamma-D-glutamyl-meso-diaminopimelate ligase